MAVEFQTSSSSHKIFRKSVPKTQIKINVMDFALSNTTFGISLIWTPDTVYELLYGIMKSTLAWEAVKNPFLEHAYKEETGSWMSSPLITIEEICVYNKAEIFINNLLKWLTHSP